MTPDQDPSATEAVRPAPINVRVRVRVLGELVVTFAASSPPIRLAASSRRLIGFAATIGKPVTRSVAAGTLWPDKPEDRAAANLRLAKFRMPARGLGILDAGDLVALADSADCDAREMESQAQRLLSGRHTDGDVNLDAFRDDLLPSWDEPWLEAERSRLHHLRVHALQALARIFAERGRAVDAVEAGLMAVVADPWSEGAARALIEAHVCDENPVEAARCYDDYRTRLRDELGVDPTQDFIETIPGVIRR